MSAPEASALDSLTERLRELRAQAAAGADELARMDARLADALAEGLDTEALLAERGRTEARLRALPQAIARLEAQERELKAVNLLSQAQERVSELAALRDRLGPVFERAAVVIDMLVAETAGLEPDWRGVGADCPITFEQLAAALRSRAERAYSFHAGVIEGHAQRRAAALRSIGQPAEPTFGSLVGIGLDGKSVAVRRADGTV